MSNGKSKRLYVLDPAELPLKGSKAEAYMREVECRVLDEHHKTFPLWALDPGIALLALVEAFDSFAVVQPMIMEHASAIGVWQYVKIYQEGYVQALRWLYARCSNSALPIAISEGDIDKAGAFLNYTANYAQVAVFHVGFGKGLYAIEADRESQIIRFRKSQQPDMRAHQYFGDLIARRQKSILKGGTNSALSIPDFAAAIGSISLEHGRIGPSSASALVCDELRAFHQRDFERDFAQLDGAARIGQSTYAEFQQYWINLSAWSTCAVRAYLTLANQDTPQSACMATQQLRRDEYIERMVRISGLSSEVVEDLTMLLTYDSRTPRPDAFLQPLIVIGDLILWSPLIVNLSRQPRNLLKLLCQTKATQDLGATLNGTRERALLCRFGERLQSRAGYAFKLNVPLKHGDSESELDLLAYRAATPSEVLVIQGKTPVTADDLHEVDTTSKDLQLGAEQCRVAESLLRAMPLQQKKQLYPFVNWEKVLTFHGLVITPDSEPGGRYDSSDIPAIALTTIEHRLRSNDLKSPRRICEACRERPWLDERAIEAQSYFRIKVQDINYEIPLTLTPDEMAEIRAEIEAEEASNNAPIHTGEQSEIDDVKTGVSI